MPPNPQIKQSNNPTIKQSLHPPLTSVNQKVILHSICLERYAPARERFGQTRESEVFGCILHGARAYARAPVRMRRRSFASEGSLVEDEPGGPARGRARAYARAPVRMRRRSFASEGSLVEDEPGGPARGRARAYARACRALYGEPRNTLNTRKWVFVDLMFEQETYAIRGAVYGVYKNLGAGFPEVF